MQHTVYANGRLGLANRDTADVAFTYELTDHLGNVRAVVDRKTLNAAAGGDTSGVSPAVAMMADYYPFGWEMPGRKRNEDDYRYGFNGKETDPETGWQDYGFRMYNPRVARFFRVDPLQEEYKHLTPYQFASNTPIMGVDQDGLELFTVHGTKQNGRFRFSQGIINVLKYKTNTNTVVNGFDWSSEASTYWQTEMDWEAAGQRLGEHILKTRADQLSKGLISETEPIVIAAYSYGGPVAFYASKYVYEKTFGFYSVGVITFGTPVRNGTAPSNPSTISEMLDFHIQIYSPSDLVADLAGGKIYLNDFTINIATLPPSADITSRGIVGEIFNGIITHLRIPESNRVLEALRGIEKQNQN